MDAFEMRSSVSVCVLEVLALFCRGETKEIDVHKQKAASRIEMLINTTMREMAICIDTSENVVETGQNLPTSVTCRSIPRFDERHSKFAVAIYRQVIH